MCIFTDIHWTVYIWYSYIICSSVHILVAKHVWVPLWRKPKPTFRGFSNRGTCNPFELTTPNGASDWRLVGRQFGTSLPNFTVKHVKRPLPTHGENFSKGWLAKTVPGPGVWFKIHKLFKMWVGWRLEVGVDGVLFVFSGISSRWQRNAAWCLMFFFQEEAELKKSNKSTCCIRWRWAKKKYGHIEVGWIMNTLQRMIH